MIKRILRSRLLRSDNFSAPADWLSTDLPLSPALKRGAGPLLKRLVEAEAIKGVLIEELAPDGGVSRLAALGVSVFIPRELMDQYVTRPIAFVFADILERTLADQSAVLDAARIARANAADGLDLVVHYMQRGWDMTDAYWRDVGSIGHQTYVEHHSGYHLKRALQEDWSSNAGIYLAAGYRELARVQTDGGPRSLFLTEAADVQGRAPGTTMSHVFKHRVPICYFSLSEQRVLSHAREWATDQEIADRMGLSLTTVKHAWQSIYQRVQENAPHILGAGDEAGRRGPEKRRRVLAFIGEHPEELRPYSRAKK